MMLRLLRASYIVLGKKRMGFPRVASLSLGVEVPVAVVDAEGGAHARTLPGILFPGDASPPRVTTTVWIA